MLYRSGGRGNIRTLKLLLFAQQQGKPEDALSVQESMASITKNAYEKAFLVGGMGPPARANEMIEPAVTVVDCQGLGEAVQQVEPQISRVGFHELLAVGRRPLPLVQTSSSPKLAVRYPPLEPSHKPFGDGPDGFLETQYCTLPFAFCWA